MKKHQISEQILSKLIDTKDHLVAQFNTSKNTIGYFYIDSLLPDDLAKELGEKFPKPSEMVLKKSLRENKYIAAQMNLYDPLLEDIIFAFQDERIVQLIAEICNINEAFPDEHLYAGGISLMGKNQFLNPHLDNSHDKNREKWRVLNLLYYVSTDWQLKNGGNLELWPEGLSGKPITIESKFNRLVVMATHQNSLHSVSPIEVDAFRKCISNYYFSSKPLEDSDQFHVTSFRGRPEAKFTDILLRTDTWLRMKVRKFFKKGVVENPHYYKKK